MALVTEGPTYLDQKFAIPSAGVVQVLADNEVKVLQRDRTA